MEGESRPDSAPPPRERWEMSFVAPEPSVSRSACCGLTHNLACELQVFRYRCSEGSLCRWARGRRNGRHLDMLDSVLVAY